MSTLYYGRAAYEGFARAYAQRHGVDVRIGGAGAASVQADGTILLPDMDTYQTEQQFADTCATIVHEISHVVYGSHAGFKSAIVGKDRLFRDCLNAVMDVSDETAIGKREWDMANERPETLLIDSTFRTVKRRWKEITQPGKAPDHWRILVCGMYRARMNGTPYKHAYVKPWFNWIHREFQGKVDLQKAFVTLATARNIAALQTPGPKRHAALVKIAEKLTVLMDAVKPLDTPGETPMPTGFGTTPMPGASKMPAGGTEATEQDGEQAAQPAQAGTGAGGGGTLQSGQTPSAAHVRAILEPVIRRVALRMATDGDGIERDGGYFSGSGVKDAYRTLTDGAAFGRWRENEHADGMAVAVLLDHSGSMQHNEPEQTSAVADAFQRGLSDCATVQCYLHSTGTSSITVEVPDFAHVPTPNGWDTYTHIGIQTADAWLSEQTAGKRVMVLITDGYPNDFTATARACCEARQKGISVIGIALACDPCHIYQSMPGCTILAAQDVQRLAIELETLTYQMEALSV